MDASNLLPAISTFNSKIAGVTFVNKVANASTDVIFYKNGAVLYTWQIRNKQYAYKTDMPIFTFGAGDRISCFCRGVTGTDPNSVVINLFVQSTDSVVGEGGGVTI